MTAPASRKNPYIGPRAFQVGEKLFGRDYEIHELNNLLLADRIVLLHAPSGAGKSSIIQAGIVPVLQSEGFTVLPVIRVNMQPPAIPLPKTFNRYVFSTLISLEERLPRDQRRSPEDLARLTLNEYLNTIKSSPHRRVSGEVTDQDDFTGQQKSPNLFLIFDQFEEVLTVDPNDQDGKAEFFRQVGEALRIRSRWALFAMREDHLAALTPYLRPVPTHLNSKYRLDFLDVESTSEAIRQPAHQAGTEFTEDAARLLIDDLRRVKVQQPDGEFKEELGLVVEPLQLQVVCNRLWDSLEKNDVYIDEEDVRSLGNVNVSLGEYYNQRVVEIVEQTGISERALRSWFQEHLITPGGIRGQVMLEAEKTKGLDNRAIFHLVNAHLVRAEKRGGTTWFELAHDRLIRPVKENNQAWFDQHLSLLQKQAALWNAQGQPDVLLLRERALKECAAWAERHPDIIEPHEQRFLQLSQAALEREKDARQLREKEIMLEAERERARLETERAEIERARAEAEKNRADERAEAVRRVSRLNRALGLMVLVALGMMGFAMFQLYRSVQETERANDAAKRASTAAAQEFNAAEMLVKEKHTAVAALGTARAANTEATAAYELTELRGRQITQQAQDVAYRVATQQSLLIVSQQEQSAPQYALPTSMLPSPVPPPDDAENWYDVNVRSRDLAQVALENIEQPSLALLIALQADRTSSTYESRNALLTSLQRSLAETGQTLALSLRSGGSPVSSLAISPDGTAVSASADGILSQWAAEASLLEGQPVSNAPPSQISTGFVDQVFYDSTASLLAVVSPRKTLTIQQRNPLQTDGIDVSHHEGKVDWEQAKTSIGFAYAKSTDANYYLDDTFADNWYGMKQAGILRGAYHVFHYTIDPERQARYFLNAVSLEPGDLPPVLDLTPTRNESRTLGANAVENILTWLEVVERETGVQPVIRFANYMVSQFVEMPALLRDPRFERFPIWVVAYQETNPGRTFQGRRWHFWSYSDKGVIPGIRGGVNLNRFNGTLENLRGLAYGAFVSSIQHAASGNLIIGSQQPIQEARTNPTGAFLAYRTDDGVHMVDTISYYEMLTVPAPGRLLGINAAQKHILLAEQDTLQFVSFDRRVTSLTLEAPISAAVSTGALLAAAVEAGDVHVFSFDSFNQEIARWTVTAGAVTSLALSQNGELLFAGTDSGVILVWDLLNGEPIGEPFAGHSGAVTHLAASPVHGVLASGGQDGQVLLWDFRPQALAQQACVAAGRDLTEDEWSRYMYGEEYQPVCAESLRQQEIRSP